MLESTPVLGKLETRRSTGLRRQKDIPHTAFEAVVSVLSFYHFFQCAQLALASVFHFFDIRRQLRHTSHL